MTEILWLDEADLEPKKQPDFGPLIPWGGGDCPVDPSAIVRLHFRGRRPYVGAAICRDIPKAAQKNMWSHAPAPGRTDPKFDVIAYQVVN